MVRHAFQHSGEARAAHALLARRVDHHAVLREHLDDRPALGDLELAAVARELDEEASLGPAREAGSAEKYSRCTASGGHVGAAVASTRSMKGRGPQR